jgi:hypothetical protein
MHGNRNKWKWREGKVDPAVPHMELYCGDWGSALQVALVAEPVDGTFIVEFPQIPQLDTTEYERIKQAVTKELTYYLVEKGEQDPWKYAIYHGSTGSNFYSDVHWGYYLGVPE